MKKNKRLGYICCVWIVALMVSCSHEINPVGDIPNEHGMVDVNVNVVFPPSQTNYLRSGDITTTAQIKKVDALIFDKDGKYIDRCKVDDTTITSTPTSASFKIKMKASNEKRTIHLVVNGRDTSTNSDRLNFNQISYGMSEQTAMELLQTNPINMGDKFSEKIFPIVMWGSFNMPNGVTANDKVENVKLLRTVATIEVYWPQSGSGILIGGYLGNTHVSSFLVPSNWRNGVQTPNSPRPQTSSSIYTHMTNPLIRANQGGVALDHFIGYSYERICTADNYHYLILQVDHSSNSSIMLSPPPYNIGYYKVALTDEDGNPINIIRNHRYIVTVEKVNGPGYYSINEAMNAAPSNDLKLKIIDENEDFPIVMAGGKHSMSISNHDICIYGGFYEWNSATNKFTNKELTLKGVELCRIITNTNEAKWRFFIKKTSPVFEIRPTLHIFPQTVPGKYEHAIMADILPLSTGGNPPQETQIATVAISYADLYYELDVIWKKREYGKAEFDIDPSPEYPEGHKSGISDNVDLFWKAPNDPDTITFKKDNWNIRVLDVVTNPEYEGEYKWMTLTDKKLADWGYGTRNYIWELSNKRSSEAYICAQTFTGNPDQIPDYVNHKATIMISGQIESTNELYSRKIIYCRPFSASLYE